MNKLYVCVVETPDSGKVVSRIYTRLDDAREWIRNRFLDFTEKNDGYAKKNFNWNESINAEGNRVWECWHYMEERGWYVMETTVII